MNTREAVNAARDAMPVISRNCLRDIAARLCIENFFNMN
jgi:hypothetical protein